ncbi:hypothetical protein HX884_25455, partial [Enterobacter sp. SECR19-1250]|nr:hypothetical protein [Enterobacter sp. SECR19-1250]
MRNNPCKTELKVARSQRNKLRTMSAKLKEMCVSVQREPSGHNLKHPTKW